MVVVVRWGNFGHELKKKRSGSPGLCYSEEPREDLLSRVVHLMARHPNDYTFQQVHDLFMLPHAAAQSPKDTQFVPVPKGLPQILAPQFHGLMPRFEVGVPPPPPVGPVKSRVLSGTSRMLLQWTSHARSTLCSLYSATAINVLRHCSHL